eukprot:m.1123 g.1123  ORF g.1123 m.1123 type:complete len:71 (+) comp5735_c0_seq1:102-314(+)
MWCQPIILNSNSLAAGRSPWWLEEFILSDGKKVFSPLLTGFTTEEVDRLLKAYDDWSTSSHLHGFFLEHS